MRLYTLFEVSAFVLEFGSAPAAALCETAHTTFPSTRNSTFKSPEGGPGGANDPLDWLRTGQQLSKGSPTPATPRWTGDTIPGLSCCTPSAALELVVFKIRVVYANGPEAPPVVSDRLVSYGAKDSSTT